MLVLRTLGAPRAGSRIRRARTREVDPGPSPTPLPLARVTVIRPRPFADEDAAGSWLDRVCSERDLWKPLAVEAVHRLNRALHAHRTAAGDPYLADIDPARAVAVRFGYGTGEEVADGHWRQARELAEHDRRRLIRRDFEALRPQERVAAVLGGRERVGAHEELLLRARGDLDAGRAATAALGLHAGLEAMARLDDLLPTESNEALRLRIEEARGISRSARERVLEGSEPDAQDLETALRAAEAAMRRRALD